MSAFATQCSSDCQAVCGKRGSCNASCQATFCGQEPRSYAGLYCLLVGAIIMVALYVGYRQRTKQQRVLRENGEMLLTEYHQLR